VFRFWFPPTGYTPPIYVTSKWWLKSSMSALPNTGTAQIEYFKFERRIKLWGIGFGWKTMNEYNRTNPSGYTAWDAVPGGTQSIDDRTGGGLSTGPQPIPFVKNWYGFPFASLKAGASLSINQDLFSFVPTTSALDAPMGTDPYSAFNFAISGNVNTSTFRYQTEAKDIGTNLSNRNHTDYTARNAKWIYNEIEGIGQTLTCSDYCTPTEITGPSAICTASTYRIIPTNTPVTWSVTPSGIVNQSVSNNEITLTKITDGTVTLSATTNATTCPATFSKTITVSSYTMAGNMYNSVNTTPVQFNGNGQSSYVVTQRGSWVGFTFNITNNTYLTNLKWYRDDINLTGTGNTFSTGVQASIYGYGTVFTNVRLEADAPCGKVRFDFGIQIQSLGWFYEPTVSPNPATDNINVNVKKVEYENAKEPTAELLEYVKNANTTFTLIDNNTGAIIKNWQFKGIETSNYSFNIANVRNGLYTLQMERLGQKYNNQVLISR
jgi:hypothetical protein